MSVTVTVRGDVLDGTSQRARLDPNVSWPDGRSGKPAFSGTFRNAGPDPVVHSPAGEKGAKAQTVGVGETSKAIKDHRWLRSEGRSTIHCTDCRIEFAA